MSAMPKSRGYICPRCGSGLENKEEKGVTYFYDYAFQKGFGYCPNCNIHYAVMDENYDLNPEDIPTYPNLGVKVVYICPFHKKECPFGTPFTPESDISGAMGDYWKRERMS